FFSLVLNPTNEGYEINIKGSSLKVKEIKKPGEPENRAFLRGHNKLNNEHKEVNIKGSD
ncbi:unnamed protein product, partial [marine sediment metagenome]